MLSETEAKTRDMKKMTEEYVDSILKKTYEVLNDAVTGVKETHAAIKSKKL